MSGGELSGEIYTSPVSSNQQTNYQSSESSITPPPPSSAFLPVLPPLPIQTANETHLSANNSLLVTTDDQQLIANNGLLSIDNKNDERSGSFIESKCKINIF
jgi:hypothetical protein